MMIETQYGSLSLKELEDSLSKYLSEEPLAIFPLKISCLLREQNLIILLHYREPAMPYPRRLFKTVRDGLSKLEIADHYQILLYLVVQGQDNSAIPVSTPLVLSTPEPQPQPLYLPTVAAPSESQPPRWLPKLFWGSVGVLTLLVVGYFSSRACLFDQCELIPQTNQLFQQSQVLLEESPDNLTKVKDNLEKSLALLATIPSWSPHRREAEALTIKHQQELERLEILLEAKASEKQALALTKPPLEISDCQEIETFWQKAISLGQSISQDSLVGPVLTEVLPAWQREQVAIANLKSALEAGNLGEARSAVATSVPNWQLARATWQTALDRLSQIPPESSLAGTNQLQELTIYYQQELQKAETKIAQENLATNLAKQAEAEAELATQMANNNQWSQAVTHWQAAITSIEKIPAQTAGFTKMQALLPTYQDNLEKAEQLLTVAVNLQQVCRGQYILCNYTLNKEIIKIVFTEVYQQELALLTIPNSPQANSLGKFFQSLSDQTGIPVEIYNPEAILIITYQQQKS